MTSLLSQTKKSKIPIHSLQAISSFIHLKSFMPRRKGVKRYTKTASMGSESADLHDNLIYIVRTPNKIYDSFKEKMKIHPRNQVIRII